MSASHQRPINYLNRKRKGGGGNGGGPGQSNAGQGQRRPFSRLVPAQTVHVPPVMMYIIGGLGILFGVLTNMWQWFTTFSAMMSIMTPNAKLFDNRSQPLKYVIAAVIATAMQFGILLLVFKIDDRWVRETKNRQLSGSEKARAYGVAAVEVIQHIDVFSVYGILSFLIDTLGDYTFIATQLQGVDAAPTIVITFLYAAGLYAMSTIAFVRSVEYVWSGIAATARLLSQSGHRQHRP